MSANICSRPFVKIVRIWQFAECAYWENQMAKTGATGIRRIINAGKYSAQGLKAAWKNEAAFRQEVVPAVFLTIAAPFMPNLALSEILILMFMPWFVVIVEILNSAIEAVVDRMGDEWNELSGRAKDLGSAAVTVALILCFGAWIAIPVARYCL